MYIKLFIYITVFVAVPPIYMLFTVLMFRDKIIIGSQSKIDYYGHNQTQSKLPYQQGNVQFRPHTLFRFLGDVQSPYCANKPYQPGLLYNELGYQLNTWTTVRQARKGRQGGWTLDSVGHTG